MKTISRIRIQGEDYKISPDLSGYATETYVNEKVGEIDIPDTSNFVTNETFTTLSNKVDEIEDNAIDAALIESMQSGINANSENISTAVSGFNSYKSGIDMNINDLYSLVQQLTNRVSQLENYHNGTTPSDTPTNPPAGSKQLTLIFYNDNDTNVQYCLNDNNMTYSEPLNTVTSKSTSTIPYTYNGGAVYFWAQDSYLMMPMLFRDISEYLNNATENSVLLFKFNYNGIAYCNTFSSETEANAYIGTPSFENTEIINNSEYTRFKRWLCFYNGSEQTLSYEIDGTSYSLDSGAYNCIKNYYGNKMYNDTATSLYFTINGKSYNIYDMPTTMGDNTNIIFIKFNEIGATPYYDSTVMVDQTTGETNPELSQIINSDAFQSLQINYLGEKVGDGITVNTLSYPAPNDEEYDSLYYTNNSGTSSLALNSLFTNTPINGCWDIKIGENGKDLTSNLSSSMYATSIICHITKEGNKYDAVLQSSYPITGNEKILILDNIPNPEMFSMGGEYSAAWVDTTYYGYSNVFVVIIHNAGDTFPTGSMGMENGCIYQSECTLLTTTILNTYSIPIYYFDMENTYHNV